MHDDREELERDHGHRDREADLGEAQRERKWDTERARETRLDQAIERLDGEVAAHEATLTIGHETGEPVEYRVVAADGDEATFGDRLRRAAERGGLLPVDEIARLIDEDAADLNFRANMAQSTLVRVLRERDGICRQIEEAVEQLRYSAVDTVASMADDGSRLEVGRRDVVDVDRLSGELDRIFGDRPELPRIEMSPDAVWFQVPGRDGAKGLTVAVNPDGSLGLFPRDPDVHPGFALHAEAARDLAAILRASLPMDVTLAVSPLASDPREDVEGYARRQFLEPLLHDVEPEHEPAHDRRERHAAKFEDREGRVEGVDR